MSDTQAHRAALRSIGLVTLLLAVAGCGGAATSSPASSGPLSTTPTAPVVNASSRPTATTSPSTLPAMGAAGTAAPVTSGTPQTNPEFTAPPPVASAAGSAAPPPTVAQAGATAPTTTPDAPMWPADCEAHYKILVFPMGEAQDSPNPVTVPAGQETHPQFFFNAPWPANVQAVKFAPIVQNPKVLHHWILNGPPIGQNGKAATSGSPTKFIAGWAPGAAGAPLPDDVGMYLPSGQLRLDVHYNNLTGTSMETDKSGLEVCVIENPAHFRKNTAGVIGLVGNATVPAHAVNYSQPAQCTAQVTGGSVYFLGVSPHMHKLGVHAFFGQTRGGMQTTLWDGPFDFNDQQIHSLDRVEVKSGDVLTTTCTYTNTTDQTVTFGENTEDEMCFNFTTYYPLGNLNCGLAL